MKPKRLPIGTNVTCKYPVEAFDSGDAERPFNIFRPGMVGTICHNDTTPVVGLEPCAYIVDFIDSTYPWKQSGGSDTQRVFLYPDNIERVSP